MVTVTAFQEISATRRLRPPIGLDRNVWNWAVAIVEDRSPAIGLALVCLLVLRSIVRAKPAEADEPAIATVSEPAADASPAKTAKVAPPHWRRDAASGRPVAPRGAFQLVEEDPETAANILRNWIGQVS